MQADPGRATPRARGTHRPMGAGAILLVIGDRAVRRCSCPATGWSWSTTIAIYALIGLSLVVLTGWAGQVSLGQMAFVGLRLRAGRPMAARWHVDTGSSCSSPRARSARSSPWWSGMPTLRARGLAFAGDHARVRVGDLRLLAQHRVTRRCAAGSPTDPFPAPHLFGVIPLHSETQFYFLTVVGARGLACGRCAACAASRTGRVLIGVRDNDAPRSRRTPFGPATR